MVRKLGAKLLVLVFGIIVLVGGIVMQTESKGYVETTAVIDHIDEIYQGLDSDDNPEYDHDVYVNYTVNGQEYTGVSDFYAGNYTEGMEIKIFYDPADPTKIHGDSKGFGVIVIVVGAVLILGAIVSFFLGR